MYFVGAEEIFTYEGFFKNSIQEIVEKYRKTIIRSSKENFSTIWEIFCEKLRKILTENVLEIG